MKKYIINWTREDYGRITLEAESAEQARELFEDWQFHESDLNVKGGSMQVVEIEEVN
jgi:hypothetical protein